MLCTRPTVYLSMILVRDLGVDHWTAVKIILRGLRKYFSVMEVIKEFVVKSYIGVSFYTDPDDSKSQSGYIFILNGGAVSWCNSKQSVIAGSMCEAEYIASSEAANEGVWMKEFISDLGVILSALGQ